MNITIDKCPGFDTFAIVNGHEIRLGRNWTELVTSEELTDSFARAFREMGATPLVMNAQSESVFGTFTHANGTVDAYTIFRTGAGNVSASYICTVTLDGERECR